MTANINFTQNTYNPSTGQLIYTLPTSQRFADMEVALMKASFYNSFKNVTTAMVTSATNIITLTFPNFTSAGTVYSPLTVNIPLAAGFYAISDINNAIWNYCTLNNLFMVNTVTKQNVYFTYISANATTYQTEIDTFLVPTSAEATTLGWTNPGTAFALSAGSVFYAPTVTIPSSFSVLLGLGPLTTPATSTSTWTGTPTVTLGGSAPAINTISSIIVRCNLICSFIGNPTDQLDILPITSQYGAIDQYTASSPIFTPVTNGLYQQIVLSFMDQNLNPLTFYDPELTFALQLRVKVGSKADNSKYNTL
jgi:hypothetical protein